MSEITNLLFEGTLDAVISEQTRKVRPIHPSRSLCRFSCGAASAVATKLTLSDTDAKDVDILNVFIKEEHEDNRRFLQDCEKWFGQSVTVLRDRKYNASTDDIWKRKRYMVGMRNAPCSVHLKHDLLDNFVEEMVCDNTSIAITQVFGFTVEEIDRFASDVPRVARIIGRPSVPTSQNASYRSRRFRKKLDLEQTSFASEAVRARTSGCR